MSNSSLDRLFEKMPALFQPQYPLKKPITIFFNLTGERGTQWTVNISGVVCRVEPMMSENADITIEMTAEDAVDLFAGRLKPRLALFTGRILVTGNMNLAMQLFDLFRLEKDRLNALGLVCIE